MQTVCGRVEAAVESYGTSSKSSGECLTVSRVMDEATRFKVGKNIHNDSLPRSTALWEPLLILSGLPLLLHRYFRSVLATVGAV